MEIKQSTHQPISWCQWAARKTLLTSGIAIGAGIGAVVALTGANFVMALFGEQDQTNDPSTPCVSCTVYLNATSTGAIVGSVAGYEIANRIAKNILRI